MTGVTWCCGSEIKERMDS